jgi:hypothetical protein
MCVHEDEKEYNKATPNKLDCPSSLRSDFEEQFAMLEEEILDRVHDLMFSEMVKVREFIIKLKNGDKNK